MNIKHLVASLCLAAAPFAASAGPLELSWTAAHTGDLYNGAANSTTTITDDKLGYNYSSPGYNGVPQQRYTFTTTAQEDGILNLQLNWSAFASWYRAYTRLYVFDDSGSKLLSTNNWANHDMLLTALNLQAGEQWGFIVEAGNYDGTGAVSGTIGVNAIPEPGSLALLGLGLFGFALARRRKA